jgi:hypothetical protein
VPRSPNVRPRLDVVALLIATVTLLLVAGQLAVPRLREEPVYRATALADGMVDIDLLVPRVNLDESTTEARPGRPVNVLSSVPEGQSLPAVEILDGWLDDNIRERRVTRWCISGDAQVQQAVREALNAMAAALAGAFLWVEECAGATYHAGGGTAARDCGISNAVGCAVRLSSRSGRVSHNPAYTDGRSNRLQVLRIVYGHEVLHIGGAGHNPCGVIRNPETGRPEPSAMTPVNLAAGSSCSQPPAYGFEPADTYYLRLAYNLSRPGERETWQLWWQQPPEGCPFDAPAWGDWCVRTGDMPALPPNGAWRMRVRFDAAGQGYWVGAWEWIS